MIWLPGFIPHVIGVVVTVKMSKQYPQYQWAMAAGGLALEGVCCLMIPFSKSYWVLMIPLSGICFGIALIDTALLPTLGYLVDSRYVSVYGSIYAIADISYSFAYAFGPIIAGNVMESIGFTALNISIAVINLAYVPALLMLRNIYDPSFKDEANILMMKDPPDKQYQTYAMQDRQVPADYSKSYGRLDDDEGDDAMAGHRVTFQETSMNANGTSSQQQYNASWGDEPQQQVPPPTANPFKSGGGSGSNPFRAN
jgi:DHA1 family vesicular acetylcholine transporter-like MFS transporter 3